MKYGLLFGIAILAITASLANATIDITVPADAFSSPPAGVTLVGAFNNWNSEANPMALSGGNWTASVNLPNGRHAYKFVWRDSQAQTHWMNDPGNSRLIDNGEAGANNFLDVLDGAAVLTTAGLEKFELDLPAAKWVSLAGDFNNWRLGQFSLVRESDGAWRADLPLQRPISYKYIVDGNWRPELPDVGEFLPDGYGGKNSFRPQERVIEPDAVRISERVAAGDEQAFAVAKAYEDTADYGHTVAWLRKIRQVNEVAVGTTGPLVLKALDIEAKVHKRWGRFDPAAACWERMAAGGLKTPESLEAINELVAYYIDVKKDYLKARLTCEKGLMQAVPNAGFAKLAGRLAAANYRTGNHDETQWALDLSFRTLPPPDGTDKDYACQMTELMLIQGYVHMGNHDWAKAREAYAKVIEWHPWPDSQNCNRARKLIEYCMERESSPGRR